MGIHQGDVFEEFIYWANQLYRTKKIAFAIKVPIPIKVLQRQAHIITKAYFEERAFVDFIGQYKGVPFCFDAKETEETDGFPLANLADHQFDYLQEFTLHGGISFLLVWFKKLNKVYRINWTTLSWYWQQHKKKVRGFSKIPISEIEFNCKEIDLGHGVCLDYLAGLEGEYDMETPAIVRKAMDKAETEAKEVREDLKVNRLRYTKNEHEIWVYLGAILVKGNKETLQAMKGKGWCITNRGITEKGQYVVMHKRYITA
jgi:recombination protein U